MSDQDNLRERIAAVMYCRKHPLARMEDALRMARGEGMTGRGQTNVVQRQYLPWAQAIIDEFGIHMERRLTEYGIDDLGYEYRIVGEWEPECHR